MVLDGSFFIVVFSFYVLIKRRLQFFKKVVKFGIGSIELPQRNRDVQKQQKKKK